VPVTYTIDREARLVRIVGSGPLTDEEMAECVSALREDSCLEPDMNTLADMREIEVAFTAQGVRTMIEIMMRSAKRRSAANAAIVVSTDVAFGMGRMLELQADGIVEPSFRIFRDLAAACDWLGIA
jgi:hypothetical protein